jgi:hypothetical protein
MRIFHILQGVVGAEYRPFALSIAARPRFTIILRYFSTRPAFVIGVIDLAVFGVKKVKRLNFHLNTA